jgi:hypothetical protein
LLPCIATEKRFVQFAANRGQNDISRASDRLHRLCFACQEAGHLGFGQRQAEELVDRGPVDRNWQQAAVHVGQDAMFVWPPLGEPAQVVHDVLRIGVENMRAVAVDQYACRVMMIIGIAADMRAPIEQKDCPAGGGKAFRQD